jgi:hypothetical protein
LFQSAFDPIALVWLMNRMNASGSRQNSLPRWCRMAYVSLIGSTEGPPHEVGLPHCSAVKIALSIEPALEIIEVRSAEFHGSNAKAWFCLSRQRTTPEPSTRPRLDSVAITFSILNEC